MSALAIELRKEKRTGVIPVLLAVGVLGAAYAFVNFLVRKDTLLNLPLAPMDVLLTQLYGMIMILNMFGIIVVACMVYNMEFMVIDRCNLPEGYDVSKYEFFQGTPTRVLKDGDKINIGGRCIQVLHTPGHSPGHMCFWEKERGYLFTGDLVYKDTLFAYYPSTDPEAYLVSLEKISALPVKCVFPAHHSLDIQPEILIRMRDAFRQLQTNGQLHHGSGTFDHGDWAVWL
ncbi:MBL fold metallo-hydrolase [uncultured Oscillibacter sp.]|uniref:MBL fold metallo-hydrolase n=1 Tax=uncultured Oscillibacter sp. TaxID=876091 RepID=UPI0025E7EA11|nr:MBL fold metallo-hydrolase [uncultured Oscillibacter sp.]